MTVVRGWRGRCLAQGNSPQAGGRLWLYQKTRERVKRTSCRHARGTRSSEVHVAVKYAIAEKWISEHMLHRCAQTMRQAVSGCDNVVEIVPVAFEGRGSLEE